MYHLDNMPLNPLDRHAGTDKQKVFGLIDAYVEASCKSYTANVTSPDFVQKQQTVLALGSALRDAIERLTGE